MRGGLVPEVGTGGGSVHVQGGLGRGQCCQVPQAAAVIVQAVAHSLRHVGAARRGGRVTGGGGVTITRLPTHLDSVCVCDAAPAPPVPRHHLQPPARTLCTPRAGCCSLTVPRERREQPG